MKIVHIIFSFSTGGAETMLVDIINEQVLNSSVNLIIINNVYNQNLIKKISKKVKVFFINREPKSKNIFDFLKLNLLLLKIAAKVIHCHNHNIIPLLFPTYWKKCVLTIHDINVKSKYFKWYKNLFAISIAVQKDIYERYKLNCVLVYNGINLDNVEKKIVIQKNYKFKILQISRLDHTKKGQDLVITALKILKEKYNLYEIFVYFIGEGQSLDYLQKLSNDLDVTSNVRFLGLMNREEIYKKIKDYDLLIQPSLFEGFGLTIVEGLAAGVPVLVSDIDGPMEIIDFGEYGYFFKTGDAEDLAHMLNSLITSDSFYDIEFSQKLINRAKLFDIKETVKNYYLQYQKL
jgi:glycosyltransferase involved in cell wall biosynthesis